MKDERVMYALRKWKDCELICLVGGANVKAMAETARLLAPFGDTFIAERVK